MTKSNQKVVTMHKNNMLSYDEICHKITQSPFREEGQKVEILELVDALRKIGYFQSFRDVHNYTFSSDKHTETHGRKLKNHSKAAYRKVKKYYKSVEQYKKERLRRKLCWLLSGPFTEAEIGNMLGVSRRTVIRDLNKIKPYFMRLWTAEIRQIREEQRKKFEALLDGLPPLKQLSLMTDLLIKSHNKRLRERQYRSHYSIIKLDYTQTDHYGLPKVTYEGKGSTLAYPHAYRVHVRQQFKDKIFEAEVGGWTITQRSGWGW